MSKAKLKRIHVNQHNIRANTKNGNEDLPVFTVKTYDGNLTANTVDIQGPSKMVYRTDDPLSCGAKCWLETRAKVIITLKNNAQVEVV